MGRDGHKVPSDDSDVLLNELGSLKALLGEEQGQAGTYTSLEQISSVEEYLRIKQLAANSGVNVEQYLSQVATGEANSVNRGNSSEQNAQDPVRNAAPSSVDDYFRSVAANKRRAAPTKADNPTRPDDNVPVLSEVANGSDANGGFSLTAHEVHQLVELIVNRKLQEMKGKLKEEVLAELQKLLPHAEQDKG